MSSAENTTFEVFQPFGSDDLPRFAGAATPDLGQQIRDASHWLYKDIEAEALPVPRGATVKSATADLLAELPLRAATYDVADTRHILRLTSRFTVPLIPARRSPAIKSTEITPLAVTTRLTVETELSSNDLFKGAIRALRGVKPDTDEVLVEGSPTLLGVGGVRRRWTRRREYAYSPKQQAAIREQIGTVLTQDRGAVSVDAHTRVGVALEPGNHWSFQCLRFHSEFRLAGSEANEPTRPALQIPSLRVVRALINRGVEIDPAA